VVDDSARLVKLGRARTDREIISFFDMPLWAIGLDAPCSLPRGLNMCCMEENPVCECRPVNPWKGRKCDQDLIKLGIRVFVPTKNIFAKSWIRRGLILKEKLERGGFRVLEVFPHGTKKRLFPGLPSKTSLEGRRQLQQRLREIIEGIPPIHHRLLSHDDLDAILAAYTCYLHWRGATELVGDREEGQVVIPKGEKP